MFLYFSEMRCAIAAVMLPSRDKIDKNKMKVYKYGVVHFSTEARFMMIQKNLGIT